MSTRFNLRQIRNWFATIIDINSFDLQIIKSLFCLRSEITIMLSRMLSMAKCRSRGGCSFHGFHQQTAEASFFDRGRMRLPPLGIVLSAS